MNKEIKNDIDISDSLFQLISVAIDMNSSEMAQHYFQCLQQIQHHPENKIFSQRQRVAEAFVLKISNRIIQRAKAQEILQQVTEEKLVYHEVAIVALLSLCELLLDELRAFDDPTCHVEVSFF